MIAGKLQQKIGESMKAHDALRTSTLRLLLSALNYEKIDKQHELSDEEELIVIKREAKKRKEAIETLRQAQGKSTTSSPENIKSRLEGEETELKILQEFMPPEMGEEELMKLVDKAIKMADMPADATHQALQAGMGKVIGLVKSKAPNADGAKIAEMVKSKLK